MLRKAVFLTMLLTLLGFGTAFAYQIDSLGSGTEASAPPTQVFVNPGGLGDVLLYGYYNVRDNRVQYFTVTNTDTENGARVRIRFREAATLMAPDRCNGSYEVLDFDICLSPGDMWGGWIQTDDSGHARLFSWDTDTYVVTWDGSTGVIFPTQYPSGVQFRTIKGNTADQTREGYFEIIAERQLSEVKKDGTCGPTLVDVKETDVGNVLMGHTYMIDDDSGATYGYAATALGDFAQGDITSGIGTPQPNLQLDGDDGLNGVNYALTKAGLATIYDVEPRAKTSVIVTFPTKWATHTATYNSTTGKCENADAEIFDDPRVIINVWDDQEHFPEAVCEFSPCPEGTDNRLPHEVNVIDLNNGGIFTSDVETVITSPYDFGWIGIDLVASTLVNPPHMTTINTSVTNGLPAIGYVVHDFDDGASTGMMPLQYISVVQ